MKNKIRVEETQFRVVPRTGVVVCNLKCDMQLQKHPAWPLLGVDIMWKEGFPKIDWSGKFRVKAKAICSPTDAFDEKKGKRIAESRAKVKMYSIANKVYKICADRLAKMSEECYKSAVTCEQARVFENDHVLELTR